MDGVLGRIRDLHREHSFETIVVEENSIGGESRNRFCFYSLFVTHYGK